MIKVVEFENFKAFKKVRIPLEPLTVFVGANSSGKTSILQGLSYLSRTLAWYKKPDCPDLLTPTYRRGANGEMRLAVSGFGEAADKESVLRVQVELDFRAQFVNGVLKDSRIVTGGDFLGVMPVLRFEVAELAAPSISGDPIPALQSNGSGLAAVLANIALTRPERFAAIKAGVKSIVPCVLDIRFGRGKLESEAWTGSGVRISFAEQLVFDMLGAPNLPAPHVSSGTLLALAILTFLYTTPRPAAILLDDIDVGLHPKAQWELIAVLRKMMAQNPELQILATSHSPYLVDHLRPEEVRATVMDEKGEAHCACLSESPDFEKWKDEMSPGEIWSVLGEEWVLKVRGQGVR